MPRTPDVRSVASRLWLPAAAALVLVIAPRVSSAQFAPPHLRPQGDTVQLVVDGSPMLLLAGELGNSSASSLAYMEPVWTRLAELNLNAVLAPVYWELVEPEEGRFDFALVDGLLAGARAHGMRLVLLWFGSWKNSMSSYVPSWVKSDPERFPRARRSDGSAMEMLTAFSASSVEADARAYAALMRHLRSVDGDRHTVVMVQVENEIGMIPEARDHAPAAEAAWREPVPGALVEYLATHRDALQTRLAERWTGGGGSWSDAFGEGVETEELFMAWHYARYVERMASAGRAEYALPQYVNAALVRPGRRPGEYPSAGPLPHLLDVWRAGAPSIDFLAPDVYFPNFVEWARAYDLPGNPLFVPEAGYAGSPSAVADAFYAFGAHDAMGFSPFSIEDAPEDDPLGEAYAVLAEVAPIILAHQGRGTMAGVRPPVAFDGMVDDAPQTVRLGDYALEVSFVDPWTLRDAQETRTHGGLIVMLGPNEYLVAGTGLTVTFAPVSAEGAIAGIERIEEGRYVDGAWQRGRVLNGDQSHQGRHLRLPPEEIGIQRVRLYRYR
jgi:beta-galactosidase GanA